MRVGSLFFIALLTAAGLLSSQEAGLFIDGVTLIDGTGKPPVSDVTIIIVGNRIQEVGPSKRVDIPAGAQRIDGRGKYVIPGLMDVHAHIRGGEAPTDMEASKAPSDERQGDKWNYFGVQAEGISALHGYLYSGVTTIFDAGNDPDFIFSLRDQERRGNIVSPRIFASGAWIIARNEPAGPLDVTIEDWVTDREKLDAHTARGPDMVKLIQDELGWATRPMVNHWPSHLLEKVIRYYHEHGIRTTIHTANELRAWEAIYAGVDTLAHPVIEAPVSEKFLNMMKVKKIPQASTLTIGEGHSRLAEHPEFLEQPLYRATVDPRAIERLKNEEAEKQTQNRWTWWMKVMTPVAQENLRRVNEVGGIVALGTDQSLGAAVHRELELLVDGGIAPLDAIRIGTLNAAIFLGKEDELGSIEPGKLADLVILNADPTRDIDNAKRIHAVIKDGRIVNLSQLQIPVNRSASH